MTAEDKAKARYCKEILKSDTYEQTDVGMYLNAAKWGLSEKELIAWAEKWATGTEEQRKWIEEMFGGMNYYKVLEYLRDDAPYSIIEDIKGGCFW